MFVMIKLLNSNQYLTKMVLFYSYTNELGSNTILLRLILLANGLCFTSRHFLITMKIRKPFLFLGASDKGRS
jgi:hypothetical protein